MSRLAVSNRAAISSAQNLVSNSTNFNAALYGGKQMCSVTSNTVANPLDGAITASTIVEDLSNTQHYFGPSLTTNIGQIATISVYAKAANRPWFVLTRQGFSAVAYFDLINGVKGSVTSIADTETSSSIENAGGGWWRVSFTYRVGSNAGGAFIMAPATGNGGILYQGTGVDSSYIYGAQMPFSNWEGPYTPTTGSIVNTGPLRSQTALSQNLYKNSQDLSASGWTQSFITRTSGQVDPFGGTGAELITVDGTNNTHQWFPSPLSTDTGWIETYSEYFKAGTGSWVNVGINNGAQGGYWDITNGVAGTLSYPAGTLSSIKSVGNGWFRVAVTFTRTSGTSERIIIPAAGNGSALNWTGNSTTSVYRFGSQLVRANWEGPYQITGATAVNIGALRNKAISRITIP